jgi:hypothetical protein
MGFFSKLKKQVSTGGIKVALTPPNAVSLGDESAECSLTLTSSDERQEIHNVYVELVLERTEHHSTNVSFSGQQSGTQYQNQDTTNRYDLARVDLGPTSIEANQSRNYTVTVPLDALRSQGAGGVELGDSTLANAAESFLRAGSNYRDQYELRAVVELDGMRNPTDTHVINVVGAANQGQFGFRLGM